MTHLANQLDQGIMKVYKKVNDKWELVFKGTNWDKGWKVADDLSAQGFEVRVD